MMHIPVHSYNYDFFILFSIPVNIYLEDNIKSNKYEFKSKFAIDHLVIHKEMFLFLNTRSFTNAVEVYFYPKYFDEVSCMKFYYYFIFKIDIYHSDFLGVEFRVIKFYHSVLSKFDRNYPKMHFPGVFFNL